LAIVAGAFLLSGCLSAREQAKLAEFPRNRVFQPESIGELPRGKDHGFGEMNRSGAQSLCLLMLAPDAMLKKRYHAEHDLTVFVVSGSAIVQVEETRYSVNPGAAVFLPRMTAYAVMPHESEKGFTAIMVFSPAFDEKDTILED
jgi:mannose-6-phosphate isomerase-like protein (cupin superfamily)